MFPIRLVSFDALHTIITPRYPIHVQYSQVFAPFLGVLPPESIKQSFKVALRAVQLEHPSYDKGAENWWRDVIRRTALGAGGNKQALDSNLTTIVDRLMKRFSSREGYRAFDDAIPTIRHLQDQLGVRVIVVSNGDSRIRAVLKDLEFPNMLEPIVLSEEEGVEKPSKEIFMKALELANREVKPERGPILPNECLHIGDELECDYRGALSSGLNALLIRRAGPAGDHEHKDLDESLNGVEVIHNLNEIVPYIESKGLINIHLAVED